MSSSTEENNSLPPVTVASPRQVIWSKLGATQGVMDPTISKEDKENSSINSSLEASLPMTTQDLHLELTATESQASEDLFNSSATQVESESVAPKAGLKRLPHDHEDDESRPEKSRKLDDAAVLKSETNDDEKKVEDSFDNSVVILDDHDSPATINSLEVVDLSTDDYSVDKSVDTESHADDGHSSQSILKASQKSVVSSIGEANRKSLTSDSQSKKSSDMSHDEVSADDEMSRQLSSSAASRLGSSLGSNMALNSPEISVSPIHLAGTMSAAMGSKLSQQSKQRTSTPGLRSPRKIEKSKLTTIHHQDSGTNSSSQETDEEKTLPLQDFAAQDEGAFKMPSDAVSPSDLALVSVIIRASDVAKLKEFLSKGLMTDYTKMSIFKGPSKTVLDMFPRVNSLLDPPNRRISDVSSISSQSRSSGYLADIGSGSSTLTSGSSNASSKRDRYSICPDAEIEKHRIISPLPTARKLAAVPEKEKEVESPMSLKPQKEIHVETVNAVGQEMEVAANATSTPRVSAQPDVVATPPEMSSTSRQRAKKLLPRHIRNSRSNSPCLASRNNSVEPSPPPAPGGITEGTKVFAKWMEKTTVFYYESCVRSISEDGKYIVKFNDGFEKTLKLNDLIRVDALEPGHQVNVIYENEKVYKVGVILAHPDLSLGPDNVSYLIEFEAIEGVAEVESRLVPTRLLHLSDEQAKKIKQDIGGIFVNPVVGRNDISLDNIVQSPRRSRAHTSIKTLTPTPKSATGRKRGGDYVDTSVVEAEESSEPSSRTPGRPRKTTPGPRAKPPPKFVNDSTTDGEQGSARKPRQSSSRSTTSNVRTEIFSGMTFLVTQSNRPSDDADSAMESETEDEIMKDLDAEAEVGSISQSSKPTMNKKKIKQMLTENGGKVLEEFPGKRTKITGDVILISDRHSLTMNYLLSIVHGFPLIHYEWVMNSVASGEKMSMKNYFLPVGRGLDKQVIEMDNIPVLTNLLDGCHVLICSEHSTFADDWKPLLARMGASVSVRTRGRFDSKLSQINVVVVDKSAYPVSIVDDALERRLTMVTSLWIINCVINGKKLPFEQFKFSKA